MRPLPGTAVPHRVSPLLRLLIHELHFGCISGSEFAQQEEDGRFDDTLIKGKRKFVAVAMRQVMDGTA